LWFGVLAQGVSIGDVGALMFALLATLCLLYGRGVATLVAVPLFTCAVLFKETALLLPLVALPYVGRVGDKGYVRATILSLLGLSSLFAIYLAASWSALPSLHGEAYATHVGANVVARAVEYARWLIDMGQAIPDLRLAMDPVRMATGVAFWAALLVVAVRGGKRGLVIGGGVLWTWCWLLPVLPLVNHAYVAYMYAAGAGCAAALAVAIDLVLEGVAKRVGAHRRASIPRAQDGGPAGRTLILPRAALRVVWMAIALLYIVAGVALNRARFQSRVGDTSMPLDPTMRKSAMAASAITSLSASLPKAASDIVILAPTELLRTYSVQDRVHGLSGRSAPDLQTAVLDSGRILPIFFPQLHRVEYGDSLPAVRPDAGLVLQANGILTFYGHAPQGLAAAATDLATAGATQSAKALGRFGARRYPADSALSRLAQQE
jgi:hypothetical protein